MSATAYIRPKAAARHFGLSESTLSRWAARGWIGVTKVDGIVWFAAQDIADVIAAGATPRTVAPITTGTRVPSDDDLMMAAFWAGTEAGS